MSDVIHTVVITSSFFSVSVDKQAGEPDPLSQVQAKTNGMPEQKKKEVSESPASIKVNLPNKVVESIPLSSEDSQLVAGTIVKVSYLVLSFMLPAFRWLSCLAHTLMTLSMREVWG